MKSIIFDFDGVIADTEEAYRKSFINMVKEYNINIPKEEWYKRFPGTGTINVITKTFAENKISLEKGINHWLENWEREYRKMINESKVRPIKGFLEFNKKINLLGIKKVIATGSHHENANLILESFGIKNEFKIVDIKDVKNPKPDPEIFLKAAEKINENPENCVVIEDSLVGIEGAKKAGMKTIALATSYPRKILEKEEPDLIYNDYTEMKAEEIIK